MTHQIDNSLKLKSRKFRFSTNTEKKSARSLWVYVWVCERTISSEEWCLFVNWQREISRIGKWQSSYFSSFGQLNWRHAANRLGKVYWIKLKSIYYYNRNSTTSISAICSSVDVVVFFYCFGQTTITSIVLHHHVEIEASFSPFKRKPINRLRLRKKFMRKWFRPQQTQMFDRTCLTHVRRQQIPQNDNRWLLPSSSSAAVAVAVAVVNFIFLYTFVSK